MKIYEAKIPGEAMRPLDDEWLQVRADEDEAIKEFAGELKKYGIPLLAR